MRVCDRFNQPLHPGLKSTTLGQNGNHYLRAKVSTVVEIATQDQGKSWLIFSARTVVLSSTDLSAAQIAQRSSSAAQTQLRRSSGAAQAQLSATLRNFAQLRVVLRSFAQRSFGQLCAAQCSFAQLSAA